MSEFPKILRPKLEKKRHFLEDFGMNYMGPEAARSGARMLAPPQSTLRPSPHDCGLVGPPDRCSRKDGHLFRANRSCFADLTATTP